MTLNTEGMPSGNGILYWHTSATGFVRWTFMVRGYANWAAHLREEVDAAEEARVALERAVAEVEAWRHLSGEMPPEHRLVIVFVVHRAEPETMRQYDIASWRARPDGSAEWLLQRLSDDFEKWGWRIVAWRPLPEAPALAKETPCAP